MRLLQWMCPPKGVQRQTRTPKGSNGEQGPDGDKSAKAFFTLTSAFAKASAVALRAMADKTADRPSLSHLATSSRPRRQGRGGYETASKPYGADGRIADEFGVCQYILTRPSPQRRGERREQRESGEKAKRQTARPSPQRRGERREQREWGNGETAKRHSLQRRDRSGPRQRATAGAAPRPGGP